MFPEYFCKYIVEILKTAQNTNTVIVDNLIKLRDCLPFWRKSLRGR